MPPVTKISDDCGSDRLAQRHSDCRDVACRVFTAKLCTISVLTILKLFKYKNAAKIVIIF